MIKRWKILRSTPEGLDVKIIAHGFKDGRKVTFRGKHCDNNYLDGVFSPSTKNKFVNSQKSVFLPNFLLQLHGNKIKITCTGPYQSKIGLKFQIQLSSSLLNFYIET